MGYSCKIGNVPILEANNIFLMLFVLLWYFLYWFLFTLMEKWKGPCICHLLILLSILSAPVLLLPGVPSIFQGVFWTNRFQGDDKTKFSNNYCPWEKAKTFSQPPNQNQEIFVSRGHYSWDIYIWRQQCHWIVSHIRILSLLHLLKLIFVQNTGHL